MFCTATMVIAISPQMLPFLISTFNLLWLLQFLEIGHEKLIAMVISSKIPETSFDLQWPTAIIPKFYDHLRTFTNK